MRFTPKQNWYVAALLGVNFTTAKVSGPSEEQLKEAMGSVAFKNLGKEDKETTLISYLTLAIAFIILLSQLGVFR